MGRSKGKRAQSPRIPTAEEDDLKSSQSGFKSLRGHRKEKSMPYIICMFCGYDGKAAKLLRPRPSRKTVQGCPACGGVTEEGTRYLKDLSIIDQPNGSQEKLAETVPCSTGSPTVATLLMDLFAQGKSVMNG